LLPLILKEECQPGWYPLMKYMNEEPRVSVVITTRNRHAVLWRRDLLNNVCFALRLVNVQLSQEEQLD
jgi:hypothetical protein